MDRIAALRNVEEALAAFEEGELTLGEAERRTVTVLRTFASEFDHPDRQVYRAAVGDRDRIVIADSAADARGRIAEA
ncbi:MAG: hypothetical protein ABEI75_01075, partial [Halobaculum sp.]